MRNVPLAKMTADLALASKSYTKDTRKSARCRTRDRAESILDGKIAAPSTADAMRQDLEAFALATLKRLEPAESDAIAAALAAHYATLAINLHFDGEYDASKCKVSGKVKPTPTAPTREQLLAALAALDAEQPKAE